jgi:hypothetical protein
VTLHATRNKGTVTVHVTYGPIRFQVEEPEGHVLQFWHELGKIVAAEDNEKRAKAGYARYTRHCGGVSVHGEPLPAWDAQDEKTREHWVAAFTE